MTDSGMTLLHQAAEGDRRALGELLQSETGALRDAIDAQIPLRLRPSTSADDLLQITCADALHAIRGASFASRNDFAAWLKRIAINNLNDAIRALDADKRGGGRLPATLDADASAQALLADIVAADGRAPSYQLRAAEAHSLLASALEALPHDYRQAIRMYDLEGRSIDEVAAAVGRSPGAVHLLRVRAHRRLREILGARRTEFRELA